MEHEETRLLIHVTVQETLTALGIDTTDPEAIIRVQKNMAWVNTRRELEERLSWKVVAAIVVLFTSGLLSMLILGAKTLLNIR